MMKMMRLKMKKINEAGKRGLLITCPPCTRPQKKCTKEVLLKVHKVWLFLVFLKEIH